MLLNVWVTIDDYVLSSMLPGVTREQGTPKIAPGIAQIVLVR